MSRGVKWRLEWAFFLGENGRRQYNRLCKGCVHPCKQSFRAVVLDCPHFQSQRVKKGMDKGGGTGKIVLRGGVFRPCPYDFPSALFSALLRRKNNVF